MAGMVARRSVPAATPARAPVSPPVRGTPEPIEAWRVIVDAADGEGPAHPLAFVTKQLGTEHDVLAPDGSEIRLLVSTSRGSMAHGTLPPGGVSLAIVHRAVEEVWYVTEGRGQVWRKLGGHEHVVDVAAGTALTIPTDTHFQFRTVGSEPLRFVMCTMPPWPGAHEAVRVPDHWPVTEAGASDSEAPASQNSYSAVMGEVRPAVCRR